MCAGCDRFALFSNLSRTDADSPEVAVPTRRCQAENPPWDLDFRYSTRRLSDAERMRLLVDRTAGIRVTYKRIKAA